MSAHGEIYSTYVLVSMHMTTVEHHGLDVSKGIRPYITLRTSFATWQSGSLTVTSANVRTSFIRPEGNEG